jgi:hypothetical protein
VLGTMANNVRGQVGIKAENYPAPFLHESGPAGEKYDVNPVTHERKQVTGEALKPVVGSGGVPVLLPPDQAVGKQPFNASIFGNQNTPDSAIQYAADYARSHGGNLPPGVSRNPLMAGRVFDRIQQDAQASGDTMGAMIARNAANKADTTSLGNLQKTMDAVTAYGNTLDKNIALLEQSFNKLDQSGSPLINRAVNAWKQGVSGDADIASTVAALKAVQTEVAKIQSGALGNAPIAEGLQKEIEQMVNKNMSPAALQGALNVFKQEGANRRESTQQQIDAIQQRMTDRAPSGQSQVSNVTRTAAGVNPAGGPAKSSNSAPAQSIPAAAVSQLKEGQHTTFKNGQTWTLQNGKPVKVSG